MSKTGKQLREEAAAAYARSQESWERSDTDGALSQWAAESTGRLRDAQADLADNGGLYEFVALFNLDGELVPAKLITSDYGVSFALLETAATNSDFTGGFVSYTKRQATYEKKGFRLGAIRMPAYCEMFHGWVGSAGQVVYKMSMNASFDDAEVLTTGEGLKHEDDVWNIIWEARGKLTDDDQGSLFDETV